MPIFEIVLRIPFLTAVMYWSASTSAGTPGGRSPSA